LQQDRCWCLRSPDIDFRRIHGRLQYASPLSRGQAPTIPDGLLSSCSADIVNVHRADSQFQMDPWAVAARIRLATKPTETMFQMDPWAVEAAKPSGSWTMTSGYSWTFGPLKRARRPHSPVKRQLQTDS
jgi:hypothetical protein